MANWWQGAIGYEVYVRSFSDSDGDGLGDLPGIRARLPYLADLGVDVVWLTPFYPSPQADHGYDVADYLDIDPRFGTLDDLDRIVDDAHELGMRVLVDLIPNHTSDQHPWFLDSRSARDADKRDYYVWRDPAPDGGPPNNWVSHFGGPAWTLDEATGQYYMHLFLPEQPDLNWAQPQVRAEFEAILAAWFARGVDGMRIDVAHSLIEDPAFRDNPRLHEPPAGASPREVFESFAHEHDLDQPGVHEIYRSWRTIADRHDALLVGEVYVLDPERLARYVDGGGLHTAFCFPVLKTEWSARVIRQTLGDALAAAGSALSLPLSSHDDPRAASRFGGADIGARRAHAYFTFLCGLPGMPWLFQGDELGLDDADLGQGIAHDPIAVRNPGATGRDAVRAPMLWEPGDGFGFTTGAPWLPFGRNRGDQHTVAVQRDDAASPLQRTRALLHARRGVPALLGDAPLTWLDDAADDVVAYRRGDEAVVILNTGEAGSVEVTGAADLIHASADGVELDGDLVHLPHDSAAILTLGGRATG